MFDVFAATDPPAESQYCGDDQHAKDVATELVRGVGFHGVNLRSIERNAVRWARGFFVPVARVRTW